jgi:hypothetical protein
MADIHIRHVQTVPPAYILNGLGMNEALCVCVPHSVFMSLFSFTLSLGSRDRRVVTSGLMKNRE